MARLSPVQLAPYNTWKKCKRSLVLDCAQVVHKLATASSTTESWTSKQQHRTIAKHVEPQHALVAAARTDLPGLCEAVLEALLAVEARYPSACLASMKGLLPASTAVQALTSSGSAQHMKTYCGNSVSVFCRVWFSKCTRAWRTQSMVALLEQRQHATSAGTVNQPVPQQQLRQILYIELAMFSLRRFE